MVFLCIYTPTVLTFLVVIRATMRVQQQYMQRLLRTLPVPPFLFIAVYLVISSEKKVANNIACSHKECTSNSHVRVHHETSAYNTKHQSVPERGEREGLEVGSIVCWGARQNGGATWLRGTWYARGKQPTETRTYCCSSHEYAWKPKRVCWLSVIHVRSPQVCRPV